MSAASARGKPKPGMNHSATVPNGYKRTEVGVIPTDWGIARLGELALLRTGPFGSALHKADYVDGGIPLINPMHIVDGLLVPESATSVSEQAAHQLAVFRLLPDDIVIARRGDMGRCALVQRRHSGWLCGTGSLIIRSSDEIDAAFLRRVLTTKRAVQAIEDASVGSTMVNLNKAALSGLRIQIPPPPEQRAIAGALSDADELLRTLETLIAKKWAIRQAAMQQLLTGKTRLPGFSGEWEKKPIGDLAAVDPENLSSATDPDYSFNYISLEQVDAGRLFGVSEEVFRTAPSRARRALRHGDVLMSTVRPNLMAHFHFQSQVANAVCSTGFAVLRARTGVADPSFVFAHLFGHVVNQQIERILTGSNYPAISSGDVRMLEVPCPPTVEEQTAIAAVLSDMDAEIAALEARRDKTRAIKQGMMQQLLTGRVRLVRPSLGEAEV